MSKAPLADVRVLELSGSVAGAYCGRLFATYGATVTLLEPAGGSPLRHLHQPPGEARDSAAFLAYAAGKRSAVADVSTPDGAALLSSLLGASDVVIVDGDEAFGRRVDDLAGDFPQSVVVSVSPFGRSGPYAGYSALPGGLYALGGYAYMTGDPGREPLIGPPGIPGCMAGANAYIGALAALFVKETTGAGQVVEVSEMESLAAAHQWTITRYEYNGRVQPRNNTRYDSLHPVCYYECADGTVAISPSTEDQLQRMMSLLERDDVLEDGRFNSNYKRIMNADAFDREIESWFRARNRDEITELMQAFRVPCAPALEVDELLAHRQLAARGYWRTEEHPEAGPTQLPGAPFRMGLTPATGGRAPLLGEHTAEVLAEVAGVAPVVAGDSPSSSSRHGPPLRGVRVLDLTRVWSGPLGTRILGDLGAEVIKIEHPAARGPKEIRNPDPVRVSFYPDNEPGPDQYNRSAAFNKLNRNKLSLVLDLAKPEGEEIFLGLAAMADVVIENYSPRVMGNLGIGFDTLSKLNPGITLVSMPGYGLDGPMRDGVAYGSTLDAECGIASLMGYEGEMPQRLGVALPDPVAGMHAVGAVLTALLQRRDTGIGQHIDLSQLESMACFLGDEVVAVQRSGRRGRHGNRHEWMAPHGIYRCDGEDDWVFIGVTSEAEWLALAGVVGGTLMDDARFASFEQRKANEDALGEAVTAWTKKRSAAVAMAELQKARVAAAAVLDAAGLAHDPQLNARDFLVTLEHASAGTHRYPGQPIKLSATPPVFERAAPLLGEHNHFVLSQLLGYTDERIAELEAGGVIASVPPG